VVLSPPRLTASPEPHVIDEEPGRGLRRRGVLLPAVMDFTRLENAHTEQRRELVRACHQLRGLIPHHFLIWCISC
jgi:hypothetical protein